jgi:hypothetical protein
VWRKGGVAVIIRTMRRPLLAFGFLILLGSCSQGSFSPLGRCEVDCPLPPTVPPVITWVQPTPGAVVGRTSDLVVSATDNVGVERVEFYYSVLGFKLHPGSVGAAPYRAVLGKYFDGFPDPAAPIFVYAVAWDLEGNSDTATITLNWNPNL